VAEKLSEKAELVLKFYPAKSNFFATGELFFLTGAF
jgi:hypothetical protein